LRTTQIFDTGIESVAKIPTMGITDVPEMARKVA
jgi:hypothetical protein